MGPAGAGRVLAVRRIAARAGGAADVWDLAGPHPVPQLGINPIVNLEKPPLNMIGKLVYNG